MHLILRRWLSVVGVFAAVALLGVFGPHVSRASGAPVMPAFRATRVVFPFGVVPNHTMGLGHTLTSQGGGQIFGFDIDQDGTIGAFATANNVQTFNETSGRILNLFPTKTPAGTSYAFTGIFSNNVGLVETFFVPKGQIYAKRSYQLVKPFTAGKFTGVWTPPVTDLDVVPAGLQNDATTVFLGFQRKPGSHNEREILFTSNVGANTFGKVFNLSPNQFCECFGMQFGAYTAGNDAAIALSPDGGTVGGQAPLNYVINLSSGQISSFSGFNNGFFHAGFVNGMAVDPSTGIEATTTELNSQVEFYDVRHKTDLTFAQLPCTNNVDQANSGAGVAIDPVHKLFLVSDPSYACHNGNDGAIVVYDEKGNFVEAISHFSMFLAEPPAVINPTTRTGWVAGPGFPNLQQFFY
jgi:hypothetical protein